MSATKTRALLLAVAAAVVAALCLPSAAGAFGTISTLGQHSEHEKITRALACGADPQEEHCFQPRSIDQLAGDRGTLGAVGSPDHPLEILGNGAAHCDDGDHLPGDPYRPGRAHEAHDAIAECVRLFDQHLDEALAAAGDLATADAIVYREADLSIDCQFPKTASTTHRAKCRVFNGLGRALHAAEDFWSHTNWGDQAEPGKRFTATGAFDITNPDGQLHTEVSPFMRYPLDPATLPTVDDMIAGNHVISGCDDSAEPYVDWLPFRRSPCADRVSHSHLNKDKGIIDWRTGATRSPGTSRGEIDDNFQRAVTGARAQARAVWGDLQREIVRRYGDRRGALIVRALTDDLPWTSCQMGGSSPGAIAPPHGSTNRAPRTTTATLDNRTDQALDCVSAGLNGGSWASVPPDSVAPRGKGTFRNESNVFRSGNSSRTTHPSGNVVYRIGTTGLTVRFTWQNPLLGSNDYGCKVLDGDRQVTDRFTCSIENPRGEDAEPKLVVARR